jgi:hypothetical protein
MGQKSSFRDGASVTEIADGSASIDGRLCRKGSWSRGVPVLA